VAIAAHLRIRVETKAFERALADLRSGTVAVNIWAASAFGLVSPPWGALLPRILADNDRTPVCVVQPRHGALERFHYFSTCYVSGRYAGPFGEDDLEVGAPFNNAYEETKHLAEAEVRARMAQGLPATIYRPSIAFGDSKTGETQKYDGLYFALQLLRQPRVAALPVFGDPTVYRANVVPCDFVVDAVAYLSSLPQSVGRTYHIADPRPLTIDEWYDALGEATGRRVVRVPLPERLTWAAVARVPGAATVLGVPPQMLDYFVHPTHYLTEHTEADLAGTGIACPPFASYADNIVDFMRTHHDISSSAMV
jgi:hypothetical protein